MKIRIYDTDYEGNAVDCTGDYFSGPSAIAVVESMKMNPFQNHLTAHEFMGQLLDRIGEKEFSLPEDPKEAALVFLQKLTALGYAEFVIDEGELEMQHGYEESPVDIKKESNNIC